MIYIITNFLIKGRSMSNKANYEVTFQYSFDEDNPSKFSDTRIKRVMNAHEGQFISDWADYGIKDMTFNISSSLETIKSIMETVLKDAERSDVRMTVFAKKKFDLVIFNLSDFPEKQEILEKIQEKSEELSFRKIRHSQYNDNEFSLELNLGVDPQQILPLAKEFLETIKAKDVALDIDSVEVLQMDNHKNKKKSSFDY